MFQVRFDVIGFDHVMNRALRDRLRSKHDAYPNKSDVNAVVQVTIEAVPVMHYQISTCKHLFELAPTFRLIRFKANKLCSAENESSLASNVTCFAENRLYSAENKSRVSQKLTCFAGNVSYGS